MSMPFITIIIGSLLELLGVGVFVYTDMKSVTSLIPTFLGAIITVFGLMATKEKLRMHAMHGAVLFGLLGAIAGLAMGLPKLGVLLNGTAERPAAVFSQLVMGVLCLIFTILCVRSFIQARKARTAGSK